MHFAMRLQRNFKNLCRPACQNQMPASLIIHPLCIPSFDRERRKRDLCAQVSHPAGSPYSRVLKPEPCHGKSRKRENQFT